MPKQTTFAKAWRAVEEALEDDDVPLLAVYDLELELDTSAVAPLVAHLDSEDLKVVLAAGLLLGRIGGTDAAHAIVPLLVPRLLDPQPLIAEQTRWILRELGASALPALMDAYASDRSRQHAIAGALAFQGPRASAAAAILREDARVDAAIADALREIEGPWPAAPEEPMPYLGETIRLDFDGPPELAAHGLELWLDTIQWEGSMEESAWNRATPPEDGFRQWRPDQIAIATPKLVVAAYSADTNGMVHATLDAPDGAKFTKQELLWAVRDAHHRIAPTNDRVFEGLEREPDGSYQISTGS